MAPGASYRKRGSGRSKRSPAKKKARKSSFKKAVTKIAKQAVMVKAEPKQRSYAINGGSTILNIKLYHNSPILESIFRTAAMPIQGISDYQRVGDRIDITKVEFRWVIGQSVDRPNVNWRWWILKAPKGLAYSYASYFQNITGNIMLDDPNPDSITVIKKGSFQISRGNNLNGTDEVTTTKRMSFNIRKNVKFGPGDAATTTNLDDYYFVWGVYDSFGTANTDNIAWYVGNQTIHYRDP